MAFWGFFFFFFLAKGQSFRAVVLGWISLLTGAGNWNKSFYKTKLLFLHAPRPGPWVHTCCTKHTGVGPSELLHRDLSGDRDLNVTFTILFSFFGSKWHLSFQKSMHTTASGARETRQRESTGKDRWTRFGHCAGRTQALVTEYPNRRSALFFYWEMVFFLQKAAAQNK